MLNILTINKKSTPLNQQQHTIIRHLLNNYFRTHIPNGQFLATINLNDMQFKWAEQFTKNNISGCWSPLYKNTVYLAPNFSVKTFREQQQNSTDDYILSCKTLYNTLVNKLQKYPQWIIDIDRYIFVKYLFDELMLTILHQLYHKYQFSCTKLSVPIYVCNFLVGLFAGYENSSKMKWLIQGNVRQDIHTNQTISTISKFDSLFFRLQSLMYYTSKDKDTTSIKNSLNFNYIQLNFILQMLLQLNVITQQFIQLTKQ